MAKVFRIHVVELNAGTTPEFFERLVIEHFLAALPLDRTPGVKAYLQGGPGARVNQYLWMFEFDSVETRNRYFSRSADDLRRTEGADRTAARLGAGLGSRVDPDQDRLCRPRAQWVIFRMAGGRTFLTTRSKCGPPA